MYPPKAISCKIVLQDIQQDTKKFLQDMRFIFHATVLARIINLAFLARNRHLAKLFARNNKTLQVLLARFSPFSCKICKKTDILRGRLTRFTRNTENYVQEYGILLA